MNSRHVAQPSSKPGSPASLRRNTLEIRVILLTKKYFLTEYVDINIFALCLQPPPLSHLK